MNYRIKLTTPTGPHPPAVVSGNKGALAALAEFVGDLHRDHQTSGVGQHGFRPPISVSIEEAG